MIGPAVTLGFGPGGDIGLVTLLGFNPAAAPVAKSSLVTLGFGADGSIGLVTLLGFGVGVVPAVVPVASSGGGGGGGGPTRVIPWEIIEWQRKMLREDEELLVLLG